MLKLLFAFILVASAIPTFSHEKSTTHYSETEKINLVSSYLCCGNEHLLEKNFRAALEDFEKAMRINNQLEETVAFGVFISFGKIIALDNLGMRSKCEQELGALFISSVEALADLELSDVQEPYDLQDLEFAENLRELAALAPTLGVRLILFKIVDAMNIQLP